MRTHVPPNQYNMLLPGIPGSRSNLGILMNSSSEIVYGAAGPSSPIADTGDSEEEYFKDEDPGYDSTFSQARFNKRMNTFDDWWNHNDGGVKMDCETKAGSSLQLSSTKQDSPNSRKRQQSVDSDDEPIIHKRARLNHHTSQASIASAAIPKTASQQISANEEFLKRRQHARLQFQRQELRIFLESIGDQLFMDADFLK